MKRAVEASEPPGPPKMKSQTAPGKVPSPAAAQLKDSSQPITSQKTETSVPVLPQRKPSTASLQTAKPEAATLPQKQDSPAPDHKKAQENQRVGSKEPPKEENQGEHKQSSTITATQPESRGFFGSGGSKTQPDAQKPAESVTGKMFGFGSSIFSSASTLITSANDQPKTTPPVSPKLSAAKDIKSPDAQKLEQQKKAQQSKETRTTASEKVEVAPSESSKAIEASQVPVKPSQSTCPLCKVELNIGSKDLPNYSSCTECKNTVCKQCGFNPSPNDTLVKEWLCLTCQMQRALGDTKSPHVAPTNLQISASPKDVTGPTEPEKKEPPSRDLSQRKPSVPAQPDTVETAKEHGGPKQLSPATSQRRPQEPQKTPGPNKLFEQPKQTERKQSIAPEVTSQESGNFFGFGSSKTQPDAVKPAESVTGKMFGFGSSIFSSASTLITSAVDQPKITPPVSPKMSPAKEIKSPAAQKNEQQKKPEQPKQTPQKVQAKGDKAPSETSVVPQATVKQGVSTCPLCKLQLNIGSKDLPNYNTCTECKNAVCNQCGFNPMLNVSDVKEWLCLTCQMQRALAASESLEPPLMKPKASPNKVSSTADAHKDAPAHQKKEIISAQKIVPDKIQGNPTPGAQEIKEETISTHQMDSTQTTTTDKLVAKDSQDSVSAPTNDGKVTRDAKAIPTSHALPGRETTAVVSDLNKPLPAKTPPVTTETKDEKSVSVQKSVEQLITSHDKVQPPKTLSKESSTVEKSLAKSAPPSTQQENQDSGGFFGFGSPKSPRASSKTTDAVTGKMLGFGSSLFSSASSLITSSVQEESRTTPPSSRKMSAPAQVSDKMLASQRSSPPVSPRMTLAKEKSSAPEVPNLEKIPIQLQQTEAPSSEKAKVNNVPAEAYQAAPKVDQSVCPLCKTELNMGSKDLPNYKTCTGCKSTVCSKCGFNPMPTATEQKEWLCLNCQMQRALGASEPPGLPMIKPQPSPSKEVPAETQQKETPMLISQDDTPKSPATLTELDNVAQTKETTTSALDALTKTEAPPAVPLSDKAVASTITKTDVSPIPSTETTKGKPGAPQQQAPKVATSTAKSIPQTDPKAGQPAQQKLPQAVTSIAKSAPSPDPVVRKLPPQQPAKAGTSPAKSVPPSAQSPKPESGGFFGFGGPKTTPSAAKSAESVTGKMFGFGSSFLSSASTLITSAVQDEPKNTPPSPRKMSAAAHVSPKTTPPASPKTLPAKDIKPPASQTPQQKKPDESQQEKTPSIEQAKVIKVPPEPPSTPMESKSAPKAELSICPLCKIKLNRGSKDPPNYNTCTECKTNVCNQCGFNPMPNVAEVNEWLCLNCQMHRALGASEPAGRPVVKPQHSPGKVLTPGSEQMDKPAVIQKEKPSESPVVKKEIPQATSQRGETPKAEAPLPTAVPRTDPPGQDSLQKTQILSSTEKGHGKDVASEQKKFEENAPKVQPPQTTVPVIKAGPTKQEVVKSPQQPLRSATPPVKSATPAAQPAKQQESGGLFGFGGPKTQPAAAKSAESVTGKMFGFGSSLFSSASTLITTAVQDEPKSTPPTPRKMSITTQGSPKSTPPTPRKMSITTQGSPKPTPPASPKMPSVKETKPQTSEPPQKAKPNEQAKEVKASPMEVKQVAPKASLSTCPLCKVELNIGSKDPPNYNTCTECKNTVCSLCGFNPMPHTSAKEWLCLNCQTQRALSGQLGDSRKMSQPLPVSAKPETSAPPATAKPQTPPTKAEPKPSSAKSQPTTDPIKAIPTVPGPKAKMEPTSVVLETTPTAASTQIEVKTAVIPTTAKASPLISEKLPLATSKTEVIESQALMKQTVETPIGEVPNTEVPKTETVVNKEAVKLVSRVTEIPKAEESKPDLSTIKAEVHEAEPLSIPVTAATSVLTPTISEEVATTVPGIETKPELSAPERIIKEVPQDDHIKQIEPTKSLQQDEVQPISEEAQRVSEVEPGSKKVAEKPVGNIADVTITPEKHPAPVQLLSNIIKEQDDSNKELNTEQITLENKADPVTATKPTSKGEEHDEEPQILPIFQELKDGQMVSDTSKNNENTDTSSTVKEAVIAERRRLTFQAMEESSESDVTPSPSPKVQRRRLKVSNVSSSSEDKTESADSNIEDEEFIRRQIMGMGDDEEMSLSEDEKQEHIKNEDVIKEAELENASVTVESLSRKSSTENAGSLAGAITTKIETTTIKEATETSTNIAFKKAIPVFRTKPSTDEEVESITESLSKGSSSVQVSGFTPRSSPTSASSLEEDSDSSPSHRKVKGDKQHRKGKHRQPTQPLPTIEDSSEEEKMKQKDKSRKDKDDVRTHGKILSPAGDASSSEDLRQVTVITDTSRTSGSEYSASMESETDARRAVQRGRKPSPTVIPYTPPDPFENMYTAAKSLKSAEEAYEEIIQKTRAIPGESPPDIEPLYGGMAIEDYLYESLVEEPDLKMSELQEEEPNPDNVSDMMKKLRSPEEVYEEMMQKKRELMMIEQEFQQAQTAMETSSPEVTDPMVIVDTCVVTIPTEGTSLTGQTDVLFTSDATSSEMPIKKKKRPAPPRPTEPPKRSEGTAVTSTQSVSIGFVRPMVPQDPALRKALFPIPDLKITQCSSGEEEDDSLAEEYGVGFSSDITPSDDSETKEEPSISPPLSDIADIEPISVVCEVPQPKPIPTPISAPELTTTPSPVSPVSPPTSPATPDSSLASNATSSSPFQAQTPLSSDSTPLSTPTPPTLFLTKSIPEILPPSSDTVSAVSTSRDSVSDHSPAAVIVTIPDVVSDPSKAQTAQGQLMSIAGEAPALALVERPSLEPVVVEMPDLVSSPSQVPFEASSFTQVSAQSPAPTALVAASPVAVSTTASVHIVSASVTLAPGPVIVQMPDLVSTTSPISAQAPPPVSALITTPAPTEARVVPSVPIQPSIPAMRQGVVPVPTQTAHGPGSAPASTTIIKKKVPPPPPPRSTSVSLPEPTSELPLVRAVHHATPTMTTTLAMGATVSGQPMQSVVVDIQPRMDDLQSDNVAVRQVVTQTRQGHVVFIVPSGENLASTPSIPQTSQKATQPSQNIPSICSASLASKVSASAPTLPPKPITKVVDAVEVPVADTPPPAPSTLPRPTVYPKPSVVMTIASTTLPRVSVTSGPSQTTKPPPPIPPKPISIPAGLVFSHKPGESVKPPPHVVPKAATLPRTKEPPNALSLSLTRPVESKLGATSPKSPLSPRHAKCLQTYVVITLPSEPGSPTEGITVQAPVRRGSIPSTKVSGVRATPVEQKTPTDAFSAQAAVRRASVPTVRHQPPIPAAQIVAVEQVTPLEVVAVKARIDSVPSDVQPQLSFASGHDTPIQLQSVPAPIKKPYVEQQSDTQQLPPTKMISEEITMPQEQATAGAWSKPSVDHHQNIASEAITVPPEASALGLFPAVPIQTFPLHQQPVTEVVAMPVHSGVPLHVIVPQNRQAAVPSTVLYPREETQIDIPEKDQDIPTDVIVTDIVNIRSPVPEHKQQVPVQQQHVIAEVTSNSKEQELPTGSNIIDNFSGIQSAPQTVQPLEVLPFVTEQLSMLQPHLAAEAVTLPSTFELPREVISTDTIVRIPTVATVPPVWQPPNLVAEVTPTPDIAKIMPQTTVPYMTTPTVNQVIPSPLGIEIQQQELPDTYMPQVHGANASSIMSHSAVPLEIIALQPERETPTEIITEDIDIRRASIPPMVQPLTGMPCGVIKTEETTSRRRTSISSIVQPSYTSSDMFTYPSAYEIPTEVVATEDFAATRRESITMQPILPLAQVINLPAEKDITTDRHPVQFPYRIPSTEQIPQTLNYPSEYDHPLEIITTEAYTRRTSMPTSQNIPQGVSVAPVTITKIQQESIESQEIRGPEKVVSSMSHMYSSSISTSGQPPESLPNLVTQVVTTEVQRTTVSVVHERLPQAPPSSVAITIQPDIAKVQPLPKQNGRIIYPGDVIDLRTMKVGLKMTEQGMDLTPPESCRHSVSSDSSLRQITAVQPEIVNLSAELTPATTLSVVTDSITIVTCTATISSYNNTPAEKPLDLQGPVVSLPLPLTTYKPFEPLAQIVYRPVTSQTVTRSVASAAQEIPMNLSFGVSPGGKQPISPAKAAISNGGPVLSLEATGAMDLSNYRPVQAMVALSGTSPGIVTTIVEDDGTPVDLTAGRRSVCCDVIYKLPFTGSCRTQPPVTSQPDNRFGYRDDHYQYDHAGQYGVKGLNGVKSSMSETNLTEAGLFSYDPKSEYDYLSGSTNGAIDLTAAKLSTGE
ncbi:protein piccolo-like [Labrus mixtus]|uniref:protein piccolo-like n=1 Tax=Labrus mixtus TaxID=508554 RepID=UPI0029BFECD0|nr:protein piccolo-like [Labrus mixtus]